MQSATPPRPVQRPRGNRGWLVVLLAVGAGLMLFAGSLACLVVVLVVVAAKKQAAKPAAPDARQEPHETGKPDPSRPYPVGLRKLTFSYHPREGAARERKVVLWYPTTGKEQPYHYLDLKGYATPDGPLAAGAHPVILFSHGYRGAALQTIFLMEAFAREGYVVAAIDHADALTERQDKPFDLGQFFDAKKWDENSFRDRHDDVVALLDHLLELDADRDSFLHGHLDHDAVGAAGHSLGGYTVMGLLGGWPEWRDERIRAGLLLSPYTLPFTKNLHAVKSPVMLQGGTQDLGITPFLQATYDPLPGPKYYLVLKDANHFEWTNFIEKGRTTTEVVGQGNGKLMTEYGIAFFNHHLRGEDAPLLRKKAEGLESYRFKAEP
jgi:predicted dienelactone hydrolase